METKDVNDTERGWEMLQSAKPFVKVSEITATGIASKSAIYNAIERRELESIRNGKSIRVVTESFHRWVELRTRCAAA